MAYIGRDISNLSDRAVLDNITTSATATFNLLLNGVAYVPSSAESLTVSLNGVIQKPQSSYTVSGSTIVFASALTSSDSIDFILAERAITLTTVGSGSVGTSQLVDGSVSNAKLANSSITLNGSAVSLGGSATVGGTNTPAFTAILDSNQTMSPNTTTKLTFTSELLDTDNAFADSKFTVPSGKDGNYLFNAKFRASNFSQTINIYIYKNGSELNTAFRGNVLSSGTVPYGAVYLTAIVPLVAGDYIEIYGDHNSGSTQSLTTKAFQGFKLL